jgi:hypothetical protein
MTARTAAPCRLIAGLSRVTAVIIAETREPSQRRDHRHANVINVRVALSLHLRAAFQMASLPAGISRSNLRTSFPMYDFTPFEKELDPQPSGRRSGPPRKFTAADVLEPPYLPPIRPKCFGCSRPLSLGEIRVHVVNCPSVSAEDLARFEAALAEFQLNPERALEIAQDFVSRVRSSFGG